MDDDKEGLGDSIYHSNYQYILKRQKINHSMFPVHSQGHENMCKSKSCAAKFLAR